MLAAVRAKKPSTMPARMMRKLGVVKTAFEKIDSEVKLHHYKIRNFEPNVRFEFERGNYIVKTAENGAELEECLKLRFEVFHREYMNKKRKIGVDVDKLDYVCDHLVIRDKISDRVIGTYRMNSSLYSDTFYSAGEFDLGSLLDLPGNKLELGRACIDVEHRKGVVINLLWRGIAEYAQRTDTKILFGCTSVKTMEPLEIGLVTKHLAVLGQSTDEWNVVPTKKFKVKQLPKVLEYLESNPYQYQPGEVAKLIPTLLNSYLKMGGKMCAEPALDREFGCIDFLTVVQVDEMSPLVKGKYKL